MNALHRANGPLDKAPTMLRDLLVAVAPVALAWVGTDVVPALEGHGGLAAVLGVAITGAIATLTPLTRRYGVGRQGEPYDPRKYPAV